MNLKLSALIVCSTLFSLSACLPQDQGTDELEEIKTKLHAYAAGQSLEVVPVRRLNPRRAFKDLNLPQKRGEADLPPIGLYVCENALFKDRCEHLTSKRGFCYKLKNGWNNKITSLCPEIDAKCTFYDDDNCKDPFLKDIKYPGIPDLRLPLPPNGLSYVNDSIGSYSCA